MFTKANAAKHGSKGGRTTVKRHGRDHMSRIGRKGYEAVIDKHFDGDESAYYQYLYQLCGWNYWLQSGRPMKYDVNGRAIWQPPTHPAHKIPF